jgi:hypothetical protein
MKAKGSRKKKEGEFNPGRKGGKETSSALITPNAWISRFKSNGYPGVARIASTGSMSREEQSLNPAWNTQFPIMKSESGSE